MSTLRYRGSIKHKHRPERGRKGTYCPEWTHTTPEGGYGSDPFKHDWEKTLAQTLLAGSEPDPDGSGKRYATMKGIAFVAQATADDTWHGYPEPWQKVPSALKDRWLTEGKVTTSDLKKYKDFPKSNLGWALDSDDE